MSCQSMRQHSLEGVNVVPAIFVVLAATVANAGVPTGVAPANAQERISPAAHIGSHRRERGR
jgi:hypothetical protein